MLTRLDVRSIAASALILFLSLQTTAVTKNRGRSTLKYNKSPRIVGAGSQVVPTSVACAACDAQQPVRAIRRGGNRSSHSSVRTVCPRKGYVDPAVANNLSRAIHDMHRAGIRPRITSAWRSSAHQAALHRCSRSGRCRHARGLYYASSPGSSRHEAGFAVDIAGVAAGRSGRRRVTPNGRRIIQIMNKNGFKWRYGLADPVHFDADPTRYGYRNLKQAIHYNQSRCRARVASSRNSFKGARIVRAQERTPARRKIATAKRALVKSSSNRTLKRTARV
jgi:D-alanyl-D-alanine carboxypeptidase-like protein